MPTFWIQIPSDQILSTMSGWAHLGESSYAALRNHLLVVVRQDSKTVSGPVHYKVDLPLGAKSLHSNKKLQLMKYTVGLQQTIQSTITSKLTSEVLSKTGASVDTMEVSAKLNSEIQARVGQELIESLQSGLSTTRTYEIESSQEDERDVEFVVLDPNGQKQIRPVFAHLELRQIFWDVYLYQADFLQLEYRKRWYWSDVRKTIIQGKVTLCQPLFTIRFYEPQEELSFKFDEYTPDVNEPDLIQSLALNSTCPKAVPRPLVSLEDLARIAFPVSKQEQKEAYEYYQEKTASGPGRIKATGSAGAKRPASRRRAVKAGGMKPTFSAAKKSSLAKKPASKTVTAAKKAPAKKATAAKKVSTAKKSTAAKKSSAKKA